MDAVLGFQDHFGRVPAIVAAAPGRVNLIGEHTDYNDGYVLPTAIPQHSQVALDTSDAPVVRVGSSDFAADGVRGYRLGGERADHTWLDYVRGITALLRAAGFALGGFDAWITSTVPLGAGLSSSAALEVALLRALRGAFALPLDDVALARLGQRAENEFVGARVGIMDQLAASLATPTTALFVDTRTLEWERVPLPPELGLVVIHSGITHDHASGEYNQRRAECEAACALLGVAALRDLTVADLPRVAALPPPLGQRARHVLTENARVLDAVAALRAADLRRLGALCNASHASLRDDYAVSLPALDLLVALAQADRAVYGARLTGGGFGGSIVALTTAADARAAGERVVAAYRARTAHPALLLVPPP